MSILTVTGGLTIAFAAFVWAVVKLIVADKDGVGVVVSGFRAFLLVLVAHLFLPGIADAVISIVGWLL